MGEQAPPWPKQGPASYFPSIEARYGRSIADWQKIIAECGLDKHMAIVGYLKAEHGMGHGHANAPVGWTLQGNVARPRTAAGVPSLERRVVIRLALAEVQSGRASQVALAAFRSRTHIASFVRELTSSFLNACSM